MKYKTIVADPPWPYLDGFPRTIPTGRSHNVKRYGTKAVLGEIRRQELPYKSMSMREIAGLPIGGLGDRDCRLFLWTTNKWLPESFLLLEGWGFRYRQILVWHKADGGPFVTSVVPNTAEFVLVAVKGSPPRDGAFPSQVLKLPAARVHSTKPDAFLDMVEEVSPGPYLEMFARRNRLGWDTWGNECLNHVGFVAHQEVANQ